jgi:formylglycine-generating enzyme required for sulfatase activity
VKLVESTIGAFCMDKLEVTTGDFEKCYLRGKCSQPLGRGGFCNYASEGRNDHPINCISWHQAVAYCESRTGRLPTEHEWEFAARGSDSRQYPWGNAAPSNQLCWGRKVSDLEGKGTCRVGEYRAGASPFGLLDMAGNLREWTASDYNPGVDDRKVQRGGAWDNSDAFGVGAIYREKNTSTIGYYNIGFRCAYAKLSG